VGVALRLGLGVGVRVKVQVDVELDVADGDGELDAVQLLVAVCVYENVCHTVRVVVYVNVWRPV